MITYEMSYIQNGAIRKFKTHDYSNIVNVIIKNDLKISDVEKLEEIDDENLEN